jgi:hypothetical protein
MTRYTATVTREGKWWMVRIPQIDGLTQARRLSEAELMARELVALREGIALGEVEVEVELVLDPVGGLADIPERLATIASKREHAAELDRRATLEAAALAKALSARDIPVRDVGAILGVSHQRAHQLVRS